MPLPTITVVIRPGEPPVLVTKGCPAPSRVMIGRLTSGVENIRDVAPEVAELVETLAKAAASEPQFPLKLHVNAAVLQVFSEGPHGSNTVSVRTTVTD